MRRQGAHPEARLRRARRSGTRSGQGLVEFSLILPFILFVCFFCVDAGRLVYTYNAISSIARDGARTASLASQTYKDCLTFSRVEAEGGAFGITADPNSTVGDSDPNNPGTPGPSTPTPGAGYVYIFPAVATGSPPDSISACSSNTPRQLGAPPTNDVTVLVQYQFVPFTPLVADLLGGITVKAISVEQDECQSGTGATC